MTQTLTFLLHPPHFFLDMRIKPEREPVYSLAGETPSQEAEPAYDIAGQSGELDDDYFEIKRD